MKDKEMMFLKIAQLEEEILKLKETIQRLEIGLELNGLEIRNI
jgi:hypothetical protein